MKINILLTGRPGVGKSTIIARILEQLADWQVSGFYTRELRGNRGRMGFEAVTMSGQRHTLAHVDYAGHPRVSKYGVDVVGFEREIVPTIDPALHPDAELIIIDEIGKMECFSARFRHTVERALDAEAQVLGTIAMRGDAFIQSIKKAREDVKVVEVTRQNRDGLVKRLLKTLAEGKGVIKSAQTEK